MLRDISVAFDALNVGKCSTVARTPALVCKTTGMYVPAAAKCNPTVKSKKIFVESLAKRDFDSETNLTFDKAHFFRLTFSKIMFEFLVVYIQSKFDFFYFAFVNNKTEKTYWIIKNKR